MNIFKLLRHKTNYSYLSRNILLLSRCKSNLNGTFQAKMFEYLLKVQEISNPNSASLSALFAKQQVLQQVKGNDFVLPDSMNICEFLEIMDFQMRENPKGITKTKIYKDFMMNVRNALPIEKLEKNDLIKLLFYIGLKKKSVQAQLAIHAVILRLKDCLDDLSLEDMCILANAIFKTSTMNLDSTVINHISATLGMNLKKVISDPAILICFTKTLRQFKCHDFDLLEKLSCFRTEWAKNLTVKAHILALFAESKYYDRCFMEFMVCSSLDDLQDTTSLQEPVSKYLTKRSRAKDLSRFLWAISTLGWKLEPSEVEQVVWPQLQGRLDSEFKKQPAILIDSLMSLCVMGYYSSDLMAWVVSSQVQQLLREQNKIQPWVKLWLLLAATQIECPNLLGSELTYRGSQLPEPTVQGHLEQRAPLQRVLAAVHCFALSLGLATPGCCFQVEPLHIAGIVIQTLRRDKEVHLEVMDMSVCLHQSFLPTGLMQLKLRLLKCRGLRVIMIEQAQLSEDDAGLFTWIEDELRKHL